MQSLSKSDEQQLLDGVKMAVSLVDDQGLSPNAALQKVAEELHYSPGFLKAACNAFNTGRQLAQWNANDTVLDKLASFPLADYDAVHDKMWGKDQEKAAAVSLGSPMFMTYDDLARQELLYLDIPSYEKLASYDDNPVVQDERAEMAAKRAYARYEFNIRLADEARREKSAASDQLDARLGQLEDYFHKFAHDRLALAQVEHATATYFGETGKALMAHVAAQFPQEKRAADYAPTWPGFHQPVHRNQAPYTLVAAVIKQAQAYQRAESAFQTANTKLAEAKDGVAPFSQPQSESSNGSPSILTPSLLPDTAGQKQASLTAGFAGGLGMGAARSLGQWSTQDRDSQVKSQIDELDSPDHLNEMRKIRAQTVLTQLMSDPENPISGYDPEEVLSAYNEMVQLAPRLADQPAAVGPLLSKRLAGNTEPFEVGETLKLEDSLKKTQPTPNYTDLMKHETSILG